MTAEEWCAGQPWRFAHDVGLLVLGFEHDGTGGIDDEFEKNDVRRRKDQGPSGEYRQQRQSRNRYVDGERVGHRLVQVGGHASPEPYCGHDGSEVIVEQHEIRCFARHVGTAFAHGDADVRALQRRCVVDAIAGHGDDLAVGLQRVDDAKLLFRHHARKDVDPVDTAAELGIA